MSEGDAGGESPFRLGAGARGMGMGRAFVTLAGDASAPFWNPAATAAVDRMNFMAFRTVLFLDTHYDYLGISYPMADLGVFSVFAGKIGTDGIERRDVYNIPSDRFSSSESRLGISYGRHIAFGLSGGITVNINSLNIDGTTGSGAGADIGFQYNPNRLKWITVGASFMDLIQPRIKLRTVEDKHRTVSRFGISGTRSLGKDFAAILALDLEKPGRQSSGLLIGTELGYMNRYFLRLGLDRNRATFGGGAEYKFVKLDYAYENIDYLGASHRISFSFTFGPSISEKVKSRRARIVSEERESWEQTLTGQADSLIILGEAQLNDGRYREAMVSFQKARGLDPGSERAASLADSAMGIIISRATADIGDRKREELISGRIESALADLNAGRFNEAISKYNILLEIDPGNTTISELLVSATDARSAEINNRKNDARRLTRSGDLVGAFAQWSTVLNLDPDDADALRGIEELKQPMRVDNLIANAVALIDAGEYRKASDILNEVKRLRPDDRSVNSLLDEVRVKSIPPTTIEDIKSNPQHWSTYLSGLESYQSSDYRRAIEIWTGLEEYYPNNADLRKNITQARDRLSAEEDTTQD